MDESQLTENEITARLEAAGMTVRREGQGLIVNAGGDDLESLCLLVARLDWLIDLFCSQSTLTDAGLGRLAGMPRLKRLNVDRTRVTGRGLAVLATFPQLREFTCRLTEHAQEGIENIAKATTLEELQLYGELADCDASPLASLKNLQKLSLLSSQIAKGLGALNACTRLEDLNLGRTRADDATLCELASLPLRRLNLAETEVGDAGVRELERCKTLEELYFRKPLITSDSLDSLRKLPNLRILMLLDMKIDTQACNTLGHMGQLRTLYFYDSACPRERRQQLQASLPECHIVWGDIFATGKEQEQESH